MMNQNYTRADLLQLLDQVGKRSYVFYCWLIQYDKLTDAYQRLLRPILATHLWQHIFRVTGQSPDLLDLETLGSLTALPFDGTYHFFKKIRLTAPDEHSLWTEFYVTNEVAYWELLQRLNDRLETDMLAVADAEIFDREHRF